VAEITVKELDQDEGNCICNWNYRQRNRRNSRNTVSIDLDDISPVETVSIHSPSSDEYSDEEVEEWALSLIMGVQYS